ncbi:MAG: hypothetical protein JNM63_04210, partial [Spirochaetia bacterium]|nr:hypothetical protein [Spirochaetia bacterium]
MFKKELPAAWIFGVVIWGMAALIAAETTVAFDSGVLVDFAGNIYSTADRIRPITNSFAPQARFTPPAKLFGGEKYLELYDCRTLFPEWTTVLGNAKTGQVMTEKPFGTFRIALRIKTGGGVNASARLASGPIATTRAVWRFDGKVIAATNLKNDEWKTLDWSVQIAKVEPDSLHLLELADADDESVAATAQEMPNRLYAGSVSISENAEILPYSITIESEMGKFKVPAFAKGQPIRLWSAGEYSRSYIEFVPLDSLENYSFEETSKKLQGGADPCLRHLSADIIRNTENGAQVDNFQTFATFLVGKENAKLGGVLSEMVRFDS